MDNEEVNRFLSEREKIALICCFEKGMIYKDVGLELNVSTERARQIIAKALRKLVFLGLERDGGLRRKNGPAELEWWKSTGITLRPLVENS